MLDEIFADRFGDISVTGSTVRIDLVSLSPTEKGADGQPSLRFRQRVVLPIEGFVRSHEMMERMLRALVERGLVNEGPPAVSGAAPSVANDSAPAGSPNFPPA